MSLAVNKRKNAYKATGKENLHCQWCFNANQPEHVVKSHNIKNNMGIVICQMLLNHQCSICKNYGHAISKCPILKEESKVRKREEYLKRKRNFQIRDESLLSDKKKQMQSRNAFAALDSDSESESETEFPALKSSNITAITTKKSVNWALVDSDSEDEE